MMMDRVRSLLDDPEFMSSLPDWFAEDLNSIRDDQPRSLNISMSDWKDKRVPIELRLVAFIVYEQMSKQIDCLTSAVDCFIKNSSGEVDVESVDAAIKAAFQIGMLNEETSQILKHSPDFIKAMSARDQDKTLKFFRDRLEAEADVFWEDWRCLYWQGIEVWKMTKPEAFKWVVDEMFNRNARLPSNGKFPSDPTLYKQLRKKPAVDWMPNRLH